MSKSIVSTRWPVIAPAWNGRSYTNSDRVPEEVVPGFYTRTFSLTENPMVDDGGWIQGGSTGQDWSDVRTGSGIAYPSHSNASDFKDSCALRTGFSANHRATGIISFTGSRNGATDTHECELLLRGAYGAHTQSMYECLCGYSGGAGWNMQIIKHTLVYGDFVDITEIVSSTPDIQHGDRFRAEVTGTTTVLIRAYINDVLIKEAHDSSGSRHLAGNPGMGFFWRGTENAQDYGFSTITLEDIAA